MNKSISKPSVKLGLSPGSLVHVGEVIEDSATMTIIDYSKDDLIEHNIDSIQEIAQYKDKETVTWLIIEGLSDIGIIEEIGSIFDVHPLVQEDILNTHQRAKFEEYEDYLYIVLKCLQSVETEFTVCYEQISILVFNNFVLVFKEKKDELFDSVKQRIRTSKGRLRTMGSDYLTYVILDAIVDQNFVLIDDLDDEINILEEELLGNEPSENTLNTIQKLKREIVGIRRQVSPVRELMNGMLRSESELISEHTHLYLRDVSDHIVRVIESVESYRDILSGLLDIYISSVSNKMNEVMKVLTVFASIFIPLTFLAGIYGMNFEYMPELKWKWAYPALWSVFIIIPITLLIYFKRKKWL